jgi:predicted phosphoribosyltransferase
MSWKPLMAAAVIAAGTTGTAIVATPVHAQDAMDQLCQKGDRKACIRFGILIGRNEQRHADWRRMHADWWWWEH